MLSAEIQAEILSRRYGKKESYRKIAQALGVNRKTVGWVVKRRSVQTEVKRGTQKSILDLHKPAVEELLRKDPDIPATTILQRLRGQGYLGGISVVRQFVLAARSAPKPKEAFLTLSFVPGECAQVDWGEFGDVFGDGVKIHAFLMVLCYSRKLYLEFTRSERFEDFVRCHERAFRYFGGMPTEAWYDNLATAVSERMGSLTRFNTRFHTYTGHHGFKPFACNPARGNEKGRVEDGVKYVRSSFWPGREFKDFADLNNQAAEWRENFANQREHRATRKVPELVFQAEEKKVLLAFNPLPYDTDEVFSKSVSPNFHITYETNQYSVPWTLSGLTVTVKIDEETIRIFFNERFITKHARSYLKHQPPFTKPEHKEGLLEQKPNAQNHSFPISVLKSLGTPIETYLKCLKASRRSLKRETSKLLALSTIYGKEELVKVVEELLALGIIGVDNIELKLKTRFSQEASPAPLQFKKEELNRVSPEADLQKYDALYFSTNAGDENDREPKPTEIMP